VTPLKKAYNPSAQSDSHDSVGGANPFLWAWIDSTVSARHYRIPPNICDSTVAIDLSGEQPRDHGICQQMPWFLFWHDELEFLCRCRPMRNTVSGKLHKKSPAHRNDDERGV
jgi:hypothetical protein